MQPEVSLRGSCIVLSLIGMSGGCGKIPSHPKRTPKNMKKTSVGIPSLFENLFVIMQENITIAQNKIICDISMVSL